MVPFNGAILWHVCTRIKFVFQTVSPVREQSVQDMVLVPQNPLEQIVVRAGAQIIFPKSGRCHAWQTFFSLGAQMHASRNEWRLTGAIVCVMTKSAILISAQFIFHHIICSWSKIKSLCHYVIPLLFDCWVLHTR